MRLIIFLDIVVILFVIEEGEAADKTFKCVRSNQSIKELEVCDGKIDCVGDGSDESYKACSEKNNRQFPRCSLPVSPQNGKYYSNLCDFKSLTGNCTDVIDNSVPNGFILHYECDYGFSLKGNTELICAAGYWEPEPKLQQCIGTCDPLYSEKLTIKCTKDKVNLPCDEPLPNKAKAEFYCNTKTAVAVKNPSYNMITCIHGEWDKPLEDDFCRLDCGRANFNTAKFENGGVPFIRFPWHASVYRLQEDKNTWAEVCSGTLISDKVIVSAAQCFTDPNTRLRLPDLERNFKIALGKTRMPLYNVTDPFAQIHDIKVVRIPMLYSGENPNLIGDIAAVVLDRPVIFGEAVRPICLDSGEYSSLEENQLVDGTEAELASWRLKDQYGNGELRVIQLNYLSRNKCLDDSPPDANFLTTDKFCAGNGRSIITCPSDMGGGLVFQNYGVYYLRGVLSVSNKICREKLTMFFTKVSTYRDIVVGTTNCRLPPAPQFGSYNILWTKLYENRVSIDVRTLNYSCADGYTLIGRSSTISCQDGIWYPEIPFCTNKCTPLSSKVLAIDCYKLNGATADCHKPLPERSIARFRCNPDTHVKIYEPKYNEIECVGLKWNKPLLIDFCKENSSFTLNLRRDVCIPPESSKLSLSCTLRNKEIPCNESVPIGTKLYFQCSSPVYMRIREFPYKFSTCVDGKWDKLLPEDLCTIVCGTSISNKVRPLIGKGKVVRHGEFPWHVAIYDKNSPTKNWQYICGGSIISRKAVITAAHCIAVVARGEQIKTNKPPESLQVAAGKFFRELNKLDEYEQVREVEYVYTPGMFLDKKRLLEYDIGFLVLKKPFDFNAFVAPACVDVGIDNFEEDQLEPGAVGNVTGWGMKEDLTNSDRLRVAQMPYVPRKTCAGTIDPNLAQFLLHDKFCAGNLSSEMSVCQGDSGGGIVFYDPGSKAYYLRGIVSVGGDACEGKQYAVFTRISSYREMVSYFVETEEFDPVDLNTRAFGSKSKSTLTLSRMN